MNKYSKLKFLKGIKARVPHHCSRCGKIINKGDNYYSESIGRVNAPGIQLKKFCYEGGSKLIKKTK